MKRTQQEFADLYSVFWGLYSDWEHSLLDDNFTTQRGRLYECINGPVAAMYNGRDERLLNIIDDKYTDEDIRDVTYREISRDLQKLQCKAGLNILEERKAESYQRQLELLECGKIEEWIQVYFSPVIKMVVPQIKENHVRGFCYVYFGYLAYEHQVTSVYNSDIDNLKKIYSEVYGKKSELYTYNLVPITEECELMAIDPPRLYDARVDKTIYLANVSKELLGIIMELKSKNMYETLSVRGSNVTTNIFDGKNRFQILLEEVQFGKAFSVDGLGNVPLTKLYSTEYEDCLWIKADASNLTFEELCGNEDVYEKSIVTQVVHLKYKEDGEKTIITHIDHEFIFYSEEDYTIRKQNAKVKGKKYNKLKSFKIDGAKIPINMMVERKIAIPGEMPGEIVDKTERVPFLVFVLKSYFRHTDLIDEYFCSLNQNI